MTRRLAPVLAALVALGLAAASSTDGARPTPYPLTRGNAPDVVRCMLLETYPRGTLHGCTDGTVRFTPRAAR